MADYESNAKSTAQFVVDTVNDEVKTITMEITNIFNEYEQSVLTGGKSK